MGKPLFNAPDGGRFEILWERKDLTQSELRRGQERLCFWIRGFAPAFAGAASRRQAEAFPRERIIFVMTGMSLKGSTDRLTHVRVDRVLCNIWVSKTEKR